ncbi:hypothetical protein ACODYM_29445 [Burkholderia gladioli]|uniref:hypothetical protein n=1 Tax=Burkholderia gladioli TaxID=28095 RepID=UPI003B514333
MDYESVSIPDAAVVSGEHEPFDVDNTWLAKEATREEQMAAMYEWFTSRYEDPAVQTPWSSEDQDYIFVWGGPYDPNDKIQDRFGGIVPFDVMKELISDLWREGGDEWAPIEHEGVDYDNYVTRLTVDRREDPFVYLQTRMEQIGAALSIGDDTDPARPILQQMAHGSCIAALEAYLWDTFSFWISFDEKLLRRFVSVNTDFQKETLKLSQIFERMDGIKEEVRTYLSKLVWHQLSKVKPMLIATFEIEVPDIGELLNEVKVRHDVIHRAGRDEEGNLVEVSADRVIRVMRLCIEFAEKIEAELLAKYPKPLIEPVMDF